MEKTPDVESRDRHTEIAGSTPARANPRVAWRIAVDHLSGVVAGETKGKAMYAAFKAARDAGFHYEFHEFRVRRAPEFDQWARLNQSGVYGEEYLPRNL